MRISSARRYFIGCLLSVLGSLPARAPGVPLETKYLIPSFDMKLSQGFFSSTRGDFFTGANTALQVGLLSKLGQKRALLFTYEQVFSGGGFRFPDTREFASKDITHLLALEYRWQKSAKLRLRPSLLRGIQYARTGTGETWGEGLYDNGTWGFSLAGDYDFRMLGHDAGLTVDYLFQSVKFPNYTDLIRELQEVGANSELAGGLKNQAVHEPSLNLDWNGFNSRLRLNFQTFTKEKVVEETGLYGDRGQKDLSFLWSLGTDRSWRRLRFLPDFRWSLHRSNQNFLLFKSLTDTAPTFQPDYYDYSEIQLGVPVVFSMGKAWALGLGLDFRHRAYGSREARDGDNQIQAGRDQKDAMTLTTLSLTKKMKALSSWVLSYSYAHALSNNHYERYMPYNYSGSSFALGYQLNY